MEFKYPKDEYVPDAMTETADWVAWKRRRIGGHAAAAIMGVHPYLTLAQVYDLIVHGIEPRLLTEEDADFLAWRASLETNIAARYVDFTERKIRRMKSKVVPWLPVCVVSPDREILLDPRGVGLLEIKSVHPSLWDRYSLTGLPEFPWVQNQFYLWGSERSWGDICCGNVNNGRLLRFEHDADVEFQKVMAERIKKFIHDCEDEIRPEEPADPVRMPAIGGDLVRVEDLDETAVTLFGKLTDQVVRWTEIASEAEEAKKAAREQLQKYMDGIDAEVAQLGSMRVYYREQAGRKSLDKVALRRDHPEVDLAKYEKQGAPYKVLRVYPNVKEGD